MDSSNEGVGEMPRLLAPGTRSRRAIGQGLQLVSYLHIFFFFRRTTILTIGAVFGPNALLRGSEWRRPYHES